MPEALGVAATALVWLVATLGAAGTGFGAVAAWTSHGHRVRLPGACTTWLDRLFGAPVHPRVVHKNAEAVPPADAVAPTPTQAAPKARQPAPPPAASAVPAPTPVEPRRDAPDAAHGHPNDAAADPSPRDAAAPDAVTGPDPASAVEAPTVATGAAKADRTADAEPQAAPSAAIVDVDAHLADICAGFEVDLNVARALHASGLDDLEHMDAWRAAMRERAAPTGIEESIWRRICGMTSEAVRQAATNGREKRGTLAVLESLWGVGPEDAAALYEAGFRDLDALREATTARLAAVGSIGRSRAFRIRAAAHGVAPDA